MCRTSVIAYFVPGCTRPLDFVGQLGIKYWNTAHGIIVWSFPNQFIGSIQTNFKLWFERIYPVNV